MLIDDLRTQALQAELLTNKSLNASTRCALAPCQPFDDYDRFELWSEGFNSRLQATRRADWKRQKIKNFGPPGVFEEGWLVCDRLLCPQLYQPSFEDHIKAMTLDWTNNFLTVEAFADHYHLPVELAKAMIEHGQFLRENELG